LMNPVEALEKAGFVIHLHVNGIIIEKDGERLCVQGMSGVPDQFSGAVLDRWGPEPARGCYNVLMLHQSVSPFMYADFLLPVESIPKGFDLYVLGHIHERKQAEHSGSMLLIPGSLVVTQQNKDSVIPKGFWIADTSKKEPEFVQLGSARKFYRIDHKGTQQELETELERILTKSHNIKPLIRVKGKGLDEPGLQSRFFDSSIITVRQELPEAPKVVSIKEHKLSVKELGREMLKKNLEKEGLDGNDYQGIFDPLVNEEHDKAIRLLRPERN